MDVATTLTAIAVPCMVVLTYLASAGLQAAAVYLREKKHNELLARVAEGAARIAGDVYETTRTLPAGTDPQLAISAALTRGANDLQSRFADTLKALGAPDRPSDLTALALGMVKGELGKLTAASPTEGLPTAPGTAADKSPTA